MIIGIAGTIGAGKGTVVDYLKQKGFAHYSGSGFLKEMLKARGLPLIRDNYSPLAREIRAQDPGGLAKISYAQYEKDGAGDAVFEALHSPGEADFIRSVGGVIIGVDAAPEVRYKRALGRAHEKDKVSYEEFLAHSAREDEGKGEGHNIRAVINSADYVIQNNGSLEELHAQIDAALTTLTNRA